MLHRSSAFPYLILLAAQLAVGSAAILARTGLKAGLSPISLAAWRLTVASVILAGGLWIARRRQRADMSATAISNFDAGWLILAGILLGIHFATWFASLQVLTVARSTGLGGAG
jgi:drug/metabolite transporter (DMT)-like permease